MFMLMMCLLLCIAKAMDGSFAECSVEDKPVDCMPNLTRVSVEHNAFY